VPRIDGHNHVVQKRKCKSIPEKPFHEREIKADAHAVLMALTVVGGGRKKTALVEIDVEIELAFARSELRGEHAFVVFVNRAIERAEVFLHLVVKRIQLLLQDAAVDVVGCLCESPCDLGRLVVSHGISVVAKAKLCGR
jgi:hypothetical protein